MKKIALKLMSYGFLSLFGFTAASAAEIVTVDNHYTAKWFGTANAYFRIYSSSDRSKCTIQGESKIVGGFSLHPYSNESFNTCSLEPCKKTVNDDDIIENTTACKNAKTFYLTVSGATGLTWSQPYPFNRGANCTITKVLDEKGKEKPGAVCS